MVVYLFGSLNFSQTCIRTHRQYLTKFSLTADGHGEAEFGMAWCAGFGEAFYISYFEVSTSYFCSTFKSGTKTCR
jgi:hypothetical protein